jgi:hypothetical protein
MRAGTIHPRCVLWSTYGLPAMFLGAGKGSTRDKLLIK